MTFFDEFFKKKAEEGLSRFGVMNGNATGA